MAAVTSAGTEAIQGLRVVKSFSMEPAINKRIGGSIERMERRSKALGRIIGLTSPMMETLGGLTIGLFIIYSGWQTLANDKSPGELMAFITAFLLAYEPAKRLANFNVQYQRNMVAVERMYNLLDKGVPEDQPHARSRPVSHRRRQGQRREPVIFLQGRPSCPQECQLHRQSR